MALQISKAIIKDKRRRLSMAILLLNIPTKLKTEYFPY